MGIGIFQTSQKNKDRIPIVFFGCNDALLLKELYVEAITALGPGLEQYNPQNGEKVKRIGEVSICSVKDDAEYIVNSEDAAEKPEGGRTPTGASGTWAVQSLIFSKDKFNLEQAQKWVTEHAGFGDYGHDETSTSFRFRQYDPEYFSEFKTITITEGISAAYGKIDKDEQQTDEEASKALEQSIALWEAVHDVNKGIMTNGLKVLANTAVIRKGDDGLEERFVMSLVLEPNDGENGVPLKPDTQKDIYSEDAVRKAAHNWMEFGGAIDLNHSWKKLGKETVRPLESYLAPVSFRCGEDEKKAYDVIKGTWMLGLRIVDDDLWKAVKEGKIGAFSIGGVAHREPVEQGV